MERDAGELGQRSHVGVQILKGIVAGGAGAVEARVERVQRPIHAAIVAEVHQGAPTGVQPYTWVRFRKGLTPQSGLAPVIVQRNRLTAPAHRSVALPLGTASSSRLYQPCSLAPQPLAMPPSPQLIMPVWLTFDQLAPPLSDL